MKKSNKIAAGLTTALSLSMMLSGTMAYASGGEISSNSGAYAIGTSSATVITPILVHELTSLTFGRLGARTDTGGFVNMDANGNISHNVAYHDAANVTRGTFRVDGESSTPYNYYVSPTVVLSAQNGQDMTVNLFSYAESSGNSGSGIILAYDTIYTYGELLVAANQPAGTYNGSYDVTVTY